MAGDGVIVPARRTEKITYAVRDIVILAEQAAKQGKEMLYLNIGDPNAFDFQTPRHIIEATYRAMLRNMNGYSPSSGVQEARDSIARAARAKGIDNILDVFITTGASEAIDVCLTALANEGENVLLPSPGYPLYSALLNKLGVEVNEYYLDEESDWQPDVRDIAKKINGKTRAIVLINPNNPTGALYREEVLQNIIELALRHRLVIFADEIYDKLIFDGLRHVSIAALNAEVPVVTLNGLSKAYLVPGFRIGWGIVSGRAEWLKDYVEAINKLLRARLCANHPEQWAIRPALEGDQSHLEDVMARLTRRRDITVRMLNAIPGISCVKPQGAFYAFPRLDVDGTDDDFVRALILETGVVVVPGSGFGQKPGTKHFRVVFLPPEKVLESAYERIGEFFARYARMGCQLSAGG
ncbi:MAG: aminotransferase class I/II-fold pyridoxal phosphate-dependent enzyme [bacterium]|nr:aminotransferase class I/II-fold pyridoxal phosphate-dependent enzyme [candidate division KSB1 bacterium]MDH7560784.1 aminotransferase class I/II-fold pyridoxal phosphate-dependent enzyme [bacterium]